MATDVLVAGAGPSGLALALQLRALGASVRVVERRTEAFRPSRALVMHPRTLEVLRPLGVTDALLTRGDTTPQVRLHLGRREVRVGLADLDLPDTPFPHLLLIRQADVEAVLAAALVDAGVVVERGTCLESVAAVAGGVRVVLSGNRSGAARYLAGCDGAASTVRSTAGIGWRGGTYRQAVVLADLELDDLQDAERLAPGEAHVVVGRGGLVFLFAIGEHATWRLLATRRPELPAAPPGQPGPAVPREQLQTLLDGAGLAAVVTDVAWSAEIRLQYRLADAFRAGRCFLVGDAAHAHSPAAAQGMNTGLQDAVNLGWKLAFAARGGTGADALLDTYELERRPVDRRVLALTHLAFWGESGLGPLASLSRGVLAPRLAWAVGPVMNQRWLVAQGVRTLSQLRTSYRASPLSTEAGDGRHSGPRAGDRLPDARVMADGAATTLHALLARPGVHVLLTGGAVVPELVDPLVHVHHVDALPAVHGPAVLVVRPDGYIGCRVDGNASGAEEDWLRFVSGAGAGR